MADPVAPPPLRRGFALADAITLVRIPLAIAFPILGGTTERLVLLGLAAATDLGDGVVARRYGGSRIGAVLDPIVDKLFMAAAFGTVLWSGDLAWWEVTALLIRDIVLSVAFFITLATGRGTAVPARFGGKVVTLLQLLTLFAFILKSSYFLRPLAWATAAVALYAIYDYNQPFFRKLNAND
ncbi:MAG: CDP-alcohol phosphatidyltransferase family protein [Gemmatimonadetes bacterium]|nr:CDP-alcohol phosphatidyltransferase family protein [Gemmatimonadota bacterium]